MGVIAFSGATHDIATDGVYITELSKDQQARFIGWQGAFYNIAKVFAMGGLVYLAGALKERVGIVEAWMIVMALCGALLFLLGIYHLRMLPSGGEATAMRERRRGAARDGRHLPRILPEKVHRHLHRLHRLLPASPRGWSSRSFRCFSTPRSTIRVSA